MLCPMCGAEVGEKIRLCDDCEAKRQARLAEEHKEEVQAEEQAEAQTRSGRKKRRLTEQAEAEEAVAAESAEKEPSAKKPKVKAPAKAVSYSRVIFLLMMLILAVVAVKLVKRAKQSSESSTVSTTTEGNSTPVTPEQHELAVQVGRQRSGLRLGEKQIQLAASIALYRATDHKLQIAFFRSLPDSIDVKALSDRGDATAVGDQHADAVLLLNMQPSASSCNMSAVAGYQLTIFRNDGALAMDSDELTFAVREAVSTTDSPSANLIFDSLSCSLHDGATLEGNFRGRKPVAVKDEALSLSWDLQSKQGLIVSAAPEPHATVAPKSTAAIHSAPFGEIGVNDVTLAVKSVVSLYYPASGGVAVGFFSDELTREEVDQIRKRKDLASFINDKRAEMVMLLEFGEGTPVANWDNLQSVSTYFYRDPGGSFNFAGGHDVVSFKRSRSELDSSEWPALSGNLIPIGKVLFSSKGRLAATEAEAKFHWELSYDLMPLPVE